MRNTSLAYFHETELMIGDEVSPDTCRFWNKEDMTKLDKDRFRRKLATSRKPTRKFSSGNGSNEITSESHISILREDLLDPAGKAVMGGLRQLGFDTVEDVRVGKQVKVSFDAARRRHGPGEAWTTCAEALGEPGH